MAGADHTTDLPKLSAGRARVRAGILSRTLRDASVLLLLLLVVAFALRTFVVGAFRIPTRSMERTLLAGDIVLVNKLAYGARSPSRVPILGLPIPSLRLPPSSRLARGDVVVYARESTSDLPSRKFLVKRCVAVAGDTVEVSGGAVTVNGIPVSSPIWYGSSPSLHHDEPLPTVSRRLVIPRKGDIVPTTSGTIDDWARAIEAEGHQVTRGHSGEVLLDGERRLTYMFRENHFFAMGDNAAVSMDSREVGSIPEDQLVGKVILVYWSAEVASAGASSFPSLASIRWDRVGALVR